MIIICEGVNASGKSTLTKFLSESLLLPVFHPGPKPKNDMSATLDCLKQSLYQNAILDRATCFTRIPYGDDNDNPDGLSDKHKFIMRLYQNLFVSKGAIIIHLIGDGEQQMKDYYTLEHVVNIQRQRNDIRELYFKELSRIPHLEYDFNAHTQQSVLDYINKRGKHVPT